MKRTLRGRNVRGPSRAQARIDPTGVWRCPQARNGILPLSSYTVRALSPEKGRPERPRFGGIGLSRTQRKCSCGCASRTGLMLARLSCFSVAAVRDIELLMISPFSQYVRSWGWLNPQQQRCLRSHRHLTRRVQAQSLRLVGLAWSLERSAQPGAKEPRTFCLSAWIFK